ncbi:MAG TPA: hypothetical protein EYP55_10715 [Anaerolineae bacterium]|nr:hypothetical protein [Anaerolineae bacterium]
MFRRLLGVAMLLIGLAGIALSITGAINSRRIIDDMGRSLETTLALTSENLDTAKEALVLAKTTVAQVNEGLDTVESAAINVSQTISETRPLLNQVAQVASRDLPESIEALQSALPDMTQAAAIIDDTLTTLSNLRIDEKILGVPIHFDLGIEYAPEVPFEESVRRIGDSLKDIPPRLRDLEGYVGVTDVNLEAISEDFAALSKDLDALNDGIADVEPLLDEYIHAATEASDLIQQARATLSGELNTVKRVVLIVMVWIGLTQIVPLYLGWRLVSGRR